MPPTESKCLEYKHTDHLFSRVRSCSPLSLSQPPALPPRPPGIGRAARTPAFPRRRLRVAQGLASLPRGSRAGPGLGARAPSSRRGVRERPRGQVFELAGRSVLAAPSDATPDLAAPPRRGWGSHQAGPHTGTPAFRPLTRQAVQGAARRASQPAAVVVVFLRRADHLRGTGGRGSHGSGPWVATPTGGT